MLVKPSTSWSREHVRRFQWCITEYDYYVMDTSRADNIKWKQIQLFATSDHENVGLNIDDFLCKHMIKVSVGREFYDVFGCEFSIKEIRRSNRFSDSVVVRCSRPKKIVHLSELKVGQRVYIQGWILDLYEISV